MAAVEDLRMCCMVLVVLVVDDFTRDVLDVLPTVLTLRPFAVSPDQSAAATAVHRRLQSKDLTV